MLGKKNLGPKKPKKNSNPYPFNNRGSKVNPGNGGSGKTKGGDRYSNGKLKYGG